MNKAQQLKQHLLNSPLNLRADEMNLFISNCQVKSHPAQVNRHFSMHYTASLILTNFTGAADVLTYVLLQWLDRVEPKRTEDAFKMDVDELDHKTVDVSIAIKLSETIKVSTATEGVTLHHIDEPVTEPILLMSGDWKLFLKDDLIATWTEQIN